MERPGVTGRRGMLGAEKPGVDGRVLLIFPPGLLGAAGWFAPAVPKARTGFRTVILGV